MVTDRRAIRRRKRLNFHRHPVVGTDCALDSTDDTDTHGDDMIIAPTDLYSAKEYRFGCYQRYSQRRIMERQPRLPRHRGLEAGALPPAPWGDSDTLTVTVEDRAGNTRPSRAGGDSGYANSRRNG